MRGHMISAHLLSQQRELSRRWHDALRTSIDSYRPFLDRYIGLSVTTQPHFGNTLHKSMRFQNEDKFELHRSFCEGWRPIAKLLLIHFSSPTIRRFYFFPNTFNWSPKTSFLFWFFYSSDEDRDIGKKTVFGDQLNGPGGVVLDQNSKKMQSIILRRRQEWRVQRSKDSNTERT